MRPIFSPCVIWLIWVKQSCILSYFVILNDIIIVLFEFSHWNCFCLLINVYVFTSFVLAIIVIISYLVPTPSKLQYRPNHLYKPTKSFMGINNWSKVFAFELFLSLGHNNKLWVASNCAAAEIFSDHYKIKLTGHPCLLKIIDPFLA